MTNTDTITTDNATNTDNICDGYHTFGELYEHRAALFGALCRLVGRERPANVFKSWKHDDGTMYDGYFIAGVYVRGLGWATYHIKAQHWSSDFRGINAWEYAPDYDGHTPEDVLTRLLNI